MRNDPFSQGFLALMNIGRKAEEEQRAKLTKCQRRRKDAASLAAGTAAFIGGPALIFGPWLVGGWVILRWILGGRS